ncbi:MAG: type II toxin-antitoxin system HipA family toxin, partial [Candidatus Krumholzibacteriota bacterium]
RHQMTLAGKRDGFTREDLLAIGREMGIRKSADIIAEVGEAVGRWAELAEAAGVPDERVAAITKTHRVL